MKIIKIDNEKDIEKLQYDLLRPVLESFEMQAKNKIEYHDYVIAAIRGVLKNLEKPIELPENYDEDKISNDIENTAQIIDKIVDVLKNMRPQGQKLKEIYDKIKRLETEIIELRSKNEYGEANKVLDKKLKLYDEYMKLAS